MYLGHFPNTYCFTSPTICVISPTILLHFPNKSASFPQQFASFPQQYASFPQQYESFPRTIFSFPQQNFVSVCQKKMVYFWTYDTFSHPLVYNFFAIWVTFGHKIPYLIHLFTISLLYFRHGCHNSHSELLQWILFNTIRRPHFAFSLSPLIQCHRCYSRNLTKFKEMGLSFCFFHSANSRNSTLFMQLNPHILHFYSTSQQYSYDHTTGRNSCIAILPS